MTIDIDLTAGFSARANVDDEIRRALDNQLQPAVVRLGYVGARIHVERVEAMPRGIAIDKANFPALKIWVRYVSGPGHRQKTDDVRLDVTFSEPPLQRADIIDIGDGIELHTYSLVDVVAEKYRALLQQAIRHRARRQDVFDLDYLLRRYAFDASTRRAILSTMRDKCQARDIEPVASSLDDPEVRGRAAADWEKIGLETGDLPEFVHCFETVLQFYRRLPWDDPGRSAPRRPSGR